MSEEIKNTTIEEQKPAEAEEKKTKKAAKKDKPLDDPEEAIRDIGKGKLKLHKPFISDDKEISELIYDFENMSGLEMARAMDKGARNGSNAFRISDEQALELFFASAGKETPGCDAQDIRRGLSGVDAIVAVQIATVFFVASSQEGSRRITK